MIEEIYSELVQASKRPISYPKTESEYDILLTACERKKIFFFQNIRLLHMHVVAITELSIRLGQRPISTSILGGWHLFVTLFSRNFQGTYKACWLKKTLHFSYCSVGVDVECKVFTPRR